MRRGGFKRLSGIIYEEAPKSHVGYDGRVTLSSLRSTQENYWVLILVPTPGVLNSGTQPFLVEQERREEPNSPSLPKKAKREQKETEYKSVVKTQYKRGSSSDNEKDIDPVGYESMEERYNKEPTRVILKLEIIIEQNKI
ncbi:hypothetical protein RclHR1_12060006 [Rhizophagus clarus]|uniref:Uncharacterized protein n=1 Tax=Rhizophagus clarus TaxID=94130 RepID=A0A2Z6QY26_9GLOM|nr:hypothetical protein RclHR1_12060006 [Rhizophagus clarus]